MSFKNRFSKSSLALLLCFLLAAASFSLGVSALADMLAASANAPLQIGIVADPHFYPDSLKGGRCEAYLNYINGSTKEYDESGALVDSALYALQEHSLENGMKYLLIPGDITKDGELEGHRQIAQRLLRFEQESGIQVIVTNGNHDINNPGAISFEGGTMHSADMTSPEQFREIYSELGWDLKCAEYTPPAGEKAGMLSYAVKLDGNYRLIVMDVCKYSKDATGLDRDKNITGGAISGSLMEWVCGQIDEATAAGETVIGMAHHSFIPHFNMHESIFSGFILDDWQRKTETLADAGMQFIFTGHMHDHKTTGHVSDNGSILYDISTASLAGYPNFFREALLDNTGEIPTVSTCTFDVDCEMQVSVDDVLFDVPFRESFSYHRTFGKTLDSFVLDNANKFVDGFISSVNTNGGIVNALLHDYGLDIEGILDGLINGGVSIGSIDIFTVKNLMSLVNDLCGQIENTFLRDSRVTDELISEVLDRVLSMPVSSYPCDKYIDTYGFGSTASRGTLRDAANSVLVYFYDCTQSVEDDPFILDFVDYFKNGSGINDLFDILYDLILNDLVRDTLLGGLSLNINTLFPPGTIGHLPASFLDMVIGILLKGDKSFKNIINSFLSLGFFKDFNSINGIADHYIDEYLTQSQLDSIGFTLSEFFDALLSRTDTDDIQAVMYAYDDCEVEASADNFRLPSMIAVTLGDDASTSRNISWYTKYSATGTDIEIIPYSQNPSFTGSPTKGGGITSAAEKAFLEYPGVDLGVIGFMPFRYELVRHTLSLTGLEPGKKYCYRVGDAEKGWWSEAGVISTADGSDDVTFLHVTDMQSQNAKQYECFRNVIDTAFRLYPETDFILSSGDQVDSGTNSKQWKWLLDVSSDLLMNTSFMPASGNHEDKGAALDKIFTLPNVPEQDTESGVFYSYDYNNAHIMVLNSNDLNKDGGLADAQISWLKKSVGDSNADWKFVVIHKAIYSNGSHFDDKDVKAIRKQLQRLMPELGIDIVFEGHDHVYLRTAPMYNNKVVKNDTSDSKTKLIQRSGSNYKASINPYGTFYVISGCAGVKNYIPKETSQTDKLFPRAEVIYSTSLPMFSAIKISGDTLLFNAYEVGQNGAAMKADSFAIIKNKTSSQATASPLPLTSDDAKQLSEEASDKSAQIALLSSGLIDALDEGFDPDETSTSANIDGTVDSTTSSSGTIDGGDTPTENGADDSGLADGDGSQPGMMGADQNGSADDGEQSFDDGISYSSGGVNSEGGADSADGIDGLFGSLFGGFDGLGGSPDVSSKNAAESGAAGAAGTGGNIPLMGGSAGNVLSAAVIFGLSSIFAAASRLRKKEDD